MAPAGHADSRPRLLLLVVIDQLPSWALERYLPHLPEQGIFRRAAAEGVYFERARYSFASTFTAPGHVAIVTGAPPYRTGIAANVRYDRSTQRKRATVADPRYPTLGYPDDTATDQGPPQSGSPLVQKLPTVGDRLVKASAGKSKVVTLSLKDRAAILTGGKEAELAIWYDAKAGGFTTSRFYTETFPPWLKRFRAEHPPSSLLQPWLPLERERMARMAQPDGSPGEGDWLGFGATFPHDPRQAKTPYRMVKLAPQVSDQLWALAEQAAGALALGRDEHIDLLVVSASGCDYAGHTFGAESGEYVDHLLRSDLAIARLYDKLRAELSVTLLITGDHGVAPLPDRDAKAGRIYPEELQAHMVAGARSAGIDQPLAALAPPFIYLSEAARRDGKARAAIIKELSAHRGIHRVYDTRRAKALRASQAPLDQAVGRSLPEEGIGDLYVVPEPGWIFGDDRPRGYGTGHGSPWDYDRHVPVLLLGAGVPRLRQPEQVPQARVQATLAAFMGVSSPPWSGEPLVVPTEAGVAAGAAQQEATD